MSNPLYAQIERATNRLAKLKARELLAEQKLKAKQSSEARRADAHRKIEMGGIVIAAGADNLDPAMLCGLLLRAIRSFQGMPDLEKKRIHDEGITHLENRAAARKGR